MEAKLKRVLSEVLDVPMSGIDDSTSPDTLEKWDSLNHLNIVMAIEEEFNVSLTDDDVLEMQNVGKIKEILRMKGIDI